VRDDQLRLILTCCHLLPPAPLPAPTCWPPRPPSRARAAYDEAIALAGNYTERAFLEGRRARVG